MRLEKIVVKHGTARMTVMSTIAKLRVGVMFLLLTSALCTIFTAIVTAVQAVDEQHQQQWPQVTARVDDCGFEPGNDWKQYHIRCHLSYAVGSERESTTLYSRNAPLRNVWQYPPNQIAPYERWVAAHPPGTPILVRFDPANHRKAVLVVGDMPGGGPHTKGNIKLLEFCAEAFLLLLALAFATRPRRLREEQMS